MLLAYLQITNFRDNLMDDSMIDNVIFKQWVSVDRSTVSMTTDDFVEPFCEKLELLLPHSFIATQQSSFFKDCRSTGELVVSADFSENYSIVLQDAAQGIIPRSLSTHSLRFWGAVSSELCSCI